MIPLMLAAAAAPLPAAAAGPLTIQTRILAERRVAAADGSTRMVAGPPAHVGPGDPVLVQVSYRNVGAQPIGGLVIANPVPRTLAYRGPGGGPAPEVSVDGRRFGPIEALRVATPAGGSRAATLSDVTHVRWRLSSPLTAGGGGEFAFQAVVR